MEKDNKTLLKYCYFTHKLRKFDKKLIFKTYELCNWNSYRRDLLKKYFFLIKGTLCEAAKVLKSFGALSVSSFATHGLFSGNAFNNIKNSVLENIVVTNTTPRKPGEESIDKITRLSVGNKYEHPFY